jgi:hypothetical protein
LAQELPLHEAEREKRLLSIAATSPPSPVEGQPRGAAPPPTVTAWSVQIPCSLIELDGSEKAREGTACRSGTSAEEEHNNDAVRAFVGDRVR